MSNKLNYEELINQINEDLDTFANSYCLAYATIARKKLYEKAKECINYFYSDYHPKKYKRTNNLRYHSIHRYGKVKNGEAGLRISSEGMSEYPEETYYYYDRENASFKDIIDDVKSSFDLKKEIRTTDPTIVANAAWVYGMHGVNYTSPKVTNPSPLKKLLSETIESESFMGDLDTKARKKASREAYNIIDFSV